MQNNPPYILGHHIRWQDITGEERAFSPEAMLALQLWLYDHNVELVSMCYRPPEFLYRGCCTQEEEREQML
jgi:hypothetical protein